ncbi:unnamed protein product [Arabis nemorensis]|uniref:Uncharacterized protein n=1 Tax=Arabis nemorensis TaxID=586526 RepID=A0A565B873_9BRAS|nr:unnamed protein product [Arabis nemorensis]
MVCITLDINRIKEEISDNGSEILAKEVVKANGLSDKVIVLHGRVGDVEIDEESMLGSVITARDRWLKPGGFLYPSGLPSLEFFLPEEYKDLILEGI